MKNTKIPRISPGKRLLYALVSLLAGGDFDIALFFLEDALHATLLSGEPARTIADTVQTFTLYAVFSFVGWMFVGLPGTLLFPAGSTTRLSWLGAISGPIALLVIFALLSRSHIYFRNLAEVSTLLAYTILVSTVSFMGYLALLRKEMKSNPTRSRRFFHQA